MINIVPIWRRRLFRLALIAICCLLVTEADSEVRAVVGSSNNDTDAPPGMVWIPGGEFTMGTDDIRSLPNERPAHRVRVEGFWIDVCDVTNADFAKFVEATGYVTTAEKKPNWEELKKGTSTSDSEAGKLGREVNQVLS